MLAFVDKTNLPARFILIHEKYTLLNNMQVAVQESIDITKSTTLVQRMQSVLFIPRNRRALSMLYPPLINILLILSSYCLWPSGFPAIVWI